MYFLLLSCKLAHANYILLCIRTCSNFSHMPLVENFLCFPWKKKDLSYVYRWLVRKYNWINLGTQDYLIFCSCFHGLLWLVLNKNGVNGRSKWNGYFSNHNILCQQLWKKYNLYFMPAPAGKTIIHECYIKRYITYVIFSSYLSKTDIWFWRPDQWLNGISFQPMQHIDQIVWKLWLNQRSKLDWISKNILMK